MVRLLIGATLTPPAMLDNVAAALPVCCWLLHELVDVELELERG